MTRKLAIAALLLLVPSMVFAQGGGGRRGGGRGGSMQGAMVNVAKVLIDAKADLVLSDEVVTKLTAVQASIDEKNKPHVDELNKILEAMRGGGGRGDPEVMQQLQTHAAAARATNDEAYEKEIKPLLTAEQVTKADAAIAAARPAGRGRRGGGGGGR